ncbi:lysozyme [Erwinia sp. Eh17-17]|uniref:lysozyme n=1 Tax=Erwinia sp. Eh17-17 TaxID=3080330 RepID=UPI003208F70A
MCKLVEILNFEEGYREVPYLDSRGYPTVAGGIKIGPKGAALSNYIFRVPEPVGIAWMTMLLESKRAEMRAHPAIAAALLQCNAARADILGSMAYQLGVEGLARFNQTLALIANGDFSSAAEAMLNSLWAKQTPARARRHAQVMRSGTWDSYRGML